MHLETVRRSKILVVIHESTVFSVANYRYCGKNIMSYYSIKSTAGKKFATTSHFLIEVYRFTVLSMENDEKWVGQIRKPVNYHYYCRQCSQFLKIKKQKSHACSCPRRK
jgi:hypothetical protein